MLNIYKDITENIYFTGTENATINNPYFLFVFTHKITLEEIIFISTNISTTNRYNLIDQALLPENEFYEINAIFVNSTLGFWGYEIYQKATDSDFTKTGTIVEYGFMTLHPSSVTLPTEYTDQSNTFKIYNGE